jgi:hypothetical protein
MIHCNTSQYITWNGVKTKIKECICAILSSILTTYFSASFLRGACRPPSINGSVAALRFFFTVTVEPSGSR